MNLKKALTGSLIISVLVIGNVSPALAHDNGGKGISNLINSGIITQAQADAFKTAMKSKLDEKFVTKLNIVLTDLVNKNSLTQAKANSIKNSASSKKSLRDLVQSGAITRAEVKLVHNAMKALPIDDISVLRDQVLFELVSKKTLTQTQSDAIKNMKQNWGKRFGKHHGVANGTASTASLTF